MELITAGTAIYIGKQLLGKTFETMSTDISDLYKFGRDRIIQKATEKIQNINDNKIANLRVTRDVFFNGSFTDESICAEYFGGVLASSRSEDGKNDDGVYYISIIKTLSSKQLLLHYLIYLSLNILFLNNPEKNDLNPGQESELQNEMIILSTTELIIKTNGDLVLDLHALCTKGLIAYFQTEMYKIKDGSEIPITKISPKSLGIQLYAIAHNKIEFWRNFSTLDFGEFNEVKKLNFYGKNIEDFLKNLNIKNE